MQSILCVGKQTCANTPRTSHCAFGSTQRFDEYLPRYQRFMHSPVYNPSFDLVTEAPDGQLTSFCIVWPDPIQAFRACRTSRHPSRFPTPGVREMCCHRRFTAGCGTWGMNRAMVCAESDNQAAVKLYNAIGFEPKFKLHTYRKQV